MGGLTLADPFIWAVGIENAHMPDAGVDELAWTGHRRRWRDDLLLARALGVSHIRHGLPWAELNPGPGRYDWSWSDEVVDFLSAIGLEPIWDLVHFGAPAWLPAGLRDPAYPEAVAAYAGAFAARYRGVVNKLTPFNEPYITALFRGGLGMWPPFEHGRDGFARSLAPIVDGLRASVQAIRASNPAAEIWQNDAVDRFTASCAELEEEARARTLERYAAFDIVEGLAGPGSELYELLTEAGMSGADLAYYAADPTPVDVIGLDYYPGSEHRLEPRRTPPAAGEWGQLAAYLTVPEPEPAGLAAILTAYSARYGKPLFIAETSAENDREAWLASTTAACARTRAAGVSVVGYTWWPLFDHIDWNTALTRLSGHVCPAGLYHLRPTVDDRQESPLRDAFVAAVRAGAPVDAPVGIPVAALTSVQVDAPANVTVNVSGDAPVDTALAPGAASSGEAASL